MTENQASENNPKKPVILCVDDESNVLTALRRTLRGVGEVLVAESVPAALDLLNETEIDILITDMRMPGQTGADLLAEVVKRGLDPIRIVLTGHSDFDLLQQAINDGRVNRYLKKPWEQDELLGVIEQELHLKNLESENRRLNAEVSRQNAELKALNEELEGRVQRRTQALEQSNRALEQRNEVLEQARRSTTRIFYNLITISSPGLGKRSLLTGKLCTLIAKELKLSDAEIGQIRLAGILSRLGLLTMSSSLRERPWYDLAGDEREEYRKHASAAADAMQPATHLQSAAEAIRHQYERFDGSGVPDHLSGTDIPIGARILSAARDYIGSMEGMLQKGKRSSSSAFDELEKAAGYLYDAEVLDALNRAIPLLSKEYELRDERVLSTAQIEPGMLLSRDLYNARHVLLLPVETKLIAQAIERLKQIEESDGTFLEIYVYK